MLTTALNNTEALASSCEAAYKSIALRVKTLLQPNDYD